MLTPSKLEVLPDVTKTMKIYDSWLKAFDNFLNVALAATDKAERNILDELGLLTLFLSYGTFKLFADTTEDDQARAMLHNAYHK